MCHRYHGNTGARNLNVKPRDLKIKTEIRKIVSVGSRKLPAGGIPLMWSGLVMSLFGRPQAVLKSKCISHDA